MRNVFSLSLLSSAIVAIWVSGCGSADRKVAVVGDGGEAGALSGAPGGSGDASSPGGSSAGGPVHPGEGGMGAEVGSVAGASGVDGTGGSDSPPGQRLPGRGAVQIAVGDSAICVLLDSGAVRCWGVGGTGQLGHGDEKDIGDDEEPFVAADVDVGGKVKQVVAGGAYVCALLTNGAVRCWGEAVRLGYANAINIGDNETPASAGDVDIGGPVAALTASNRHTCALLVSGAVRCWGNGSWGQLGYGNVEDIGDDETPASAGDVDVGGTVAALSAGPDMTCALLNNGKVRCWGIGGSGGLGYANQNNIGDDETPASAGDIDVGGTVTQISAGGENACALLSTGHVRCWGEAYDGRLGYGNTTRIGDNETPATAGDVDVGGTVTAISAGASHVCALLQGGTVRCWGAWNYGDLGYGNTDSVGDDETPASVGDVDVGGTVTQIAAARDRTCALLDTGGVRCWGNGNLSVLGYQTRTAVGDDEPPADMGDIPY